MHRVPIVNNNSSSFESIFLFSQKKSPFVMYPLPLTSITLSFAYIFLTVIWFFVNVPVLSTHITSVLPKVSTEGSFLTKTFLFIIFWTPKAKEIVTTAGKPSGIAATAKLIAVTSISAAFPSLKTPTKNTIKLMKITAIPSHFPKTPNFF